VLVVYLEVPGCSVVISRALTHVEYSVTFVLKKLVKESPLLLLGSAMVTFILSAAYAMRSIERYPLVFFVV
jgi:hypothetical protein